jgi:excisionase family DNA binding protein
MTFLTVEEVAEQFRTTPDHIRRQAAAGSIPAFKPGRRWLFHPELIDKYSRGEWVSTKEKRVDPGTSSSLLAAKLFAEAPDRPTERSLKSTKRRSATPTSAKRN